MSVRLTCKWFAIRSFVLFAVCLSTSVANATGGATIIRAVTNYFGKESAGEAAQWMAKSGAREVTERLATKATAEGGEATLERVASFAGKYGPDAVRGLDNVPNLRPVLSMLDELPESQIGPALARLGAGQQGKEVADTVARYGVAAMRAELKHPGVGAKFANGLGNDGIALAEKLSTEQAIAIGRHVDDIAKLPSQQKSALVSVISEQSDRFASFVGDFVKQNPGKTLFTLSTTTVILANRDAILGGDEIVFDKDGNPILLSKQGLLERAASRATTEVTDRFISPMVQVFVPIGALAVAAFCGIKLFGVWKRQQLAIASETGKQPGDVN